MGVTRAFQGHGIDLRPEHYQDLLAQRPRIDWIEVVSDRFLHGGETRRVGTLERIRADYPITLHGLGLSIGSVDPLNMDYVQRLAALARRVDPVWISDHLAWSSYAGSELDLLPLPFTDEALRHVVQRVRVVQDYLNRQILLENPSSYVTFRESTMTEAQFLAQVAEQADCGILLDINNMYVSGRNNGFDPHAYLLELPGERVCQIHLAGHHDTGDLLVDTHEGPIQEPVWDLYRQAIDLWGRLPTIVEWDTGTPSLEQLLAEARKSAMIATEVLV
jgi:hypothetical protein